MTDNVTLNSGSGGSTLATDDISGVHYQRVKVTYGTDGSATDVSTTNPMPISDAGGSITVDGSLTTVGTVSTITNVVHVDDNSGSLTVDNAVLSVTGGGVEASALRVTIASDSTGVLSVDDNGGSLTVDGTVAATQSGTWNITNVSGTVSLPTGAATAAKQPALGTAGSASADVITVQGIASMTALKVDGSAVTQPVSGTVTATIAAGASTIAKAEDAASADADVGVPAMAVRKAAPANTSGADGDYEMLQMSAGRLWVDASGVTLTVGSHAVTNAGTFATQIDGAALTSLQLIDDAVSGTGFNISQMNGANVTMGNGASGTGVQRVTIANDSTGVLATLTTLTGSGVAHDGADSGNPHKIGAKAETALSGITLVADGDRTDLYAGVDGVLITRPHCNLEDIVTGNASNTDGTSTSCIAAQGAGVKTYLMSFTVTNTSASNTYCEIKDGTTAKYTVSVPANGGVVVNLPIPIPGTANTAWNFDMGAATTTAYCSMVGFKSKV